MEQAVGNLVRAAFEGHDVMVLDWRGQPAMLARDVGNALGYGDDKALSQLLGREWAEDFVDGIDVIKVSGPELSALKSAGLVGKNAPSALLLTESGVNLAAILSRRPESTRLRQWLAREVMPAIRKQGAYAAPSRAAILAEVHDRGHLTDGALVAELSDAEMAKLDPAKLVGLVRKLASGPAPKPAAPKRMSAIHAARSVLASALEQRERLATTGGPGSKEQGEFIGRFSVDGDGWEWIALRREFVDRHLKAMGLVPPRVLGAWRDENIVNGRGGVKQVTTRPTSMPGRVDREEMIRFDRRTVDQLLDRTGPFNAVTAFLGAAKDGADADLLEGAVEWVEH